MSNPDSVILEEEMDENYEPSHEGTSIGACACFFGQVKPRIQRGVVWASSKRRASSPHSGLPPSCRKGHFVIPPPIASSIHSTSTAFPNGAPFDFAAQNAFPLYGRTSSRAHRTCGTYGPNSHLIS
jgi:hypothetical protein